MRSEETVVTIQEHFRMELTGIFSSAQRRKANEGVRIAHLDPNTRMNSKDEFRCVQVQQSPGIRTKVYNDADWDGHCQWAVVLHGL